MRYSTAGLIVLTALAAPAVLRAETLEEVEKKIAELTTKHKSVEMKMKTKVDMSTEQMSEKSESESTVIYAKKGDKWLSRNETKTTGTRKITGTDEEKVNMKMLSVHDGERNYTLLETGDLKQATRQKAQAQDPFGNDMWKEMHKHMEIKLLPDETIDGKSAWVIEMRPKTDPDAPPEAKEAVKNTRSVTYYRKSDGAAVKSVTYEKDKPTVTMTLTDIKYDFEPKPDTFKFTAPEGVTVMDMDEIMAGQQQNQATADGSGEDAAPKPEEKPAEETKADSGDDSAQAKKEEPKEEPKKEKGIKGLLNKLR